MFFMDGEKGGYGLDASEVDERGYSPLHAALDTGRSFRSSECDDT